MPTTAWSEATPSEYGFYSNVNPEVDHPRWIAGARAADRRALAQADAHVQWLRRSGRVDVRGDGSEEVLLRLPASSFRLPASSSIVSPNAESQKPEAGGWKLEAERIHALRQTRRLCRRALAVPLADVQGIHGRLSANPIEDITLTTGIWALRWLLVIAGHHAAPAPHRLAAGHPVPPDVRPVRLLLCIDALPDLRRSRSGLWPSSSSSPTSSSGRTSRWG